MNIASYAQENGIFSRKVNHPHNLLGHVVLLCVFVLLSIFILSKTAFAQERFTIQSSSRGMENAKQAAQIRQLQVRDGQQDSRLDAVESDIGKIDDHAWKSLAQCGIGSGANGTGYKITWHPTGSGSWGCIQETDPTVKAFAKTDLPTCGAGQVLRADGSKFICTSSEGAAGFEVDPYVQDFARNTAYTISACASDEILTMTASRLKCMKSKDLSVTETDPTVQPFAKAELPNCAAGEVLTTAMSTGGMAVLRCVTDSDGGYVELDPSVGTITNNKWCVAITGKIHCNQEPPVLTEADPKIGTLTSNSWCRAVSGKVVCDQPEPSSDNLGNHTATQNLSMAGKAIVNASTITATSSITASAYYQSSDRNLKGNITSIANPFILLNSIEGKHYVWKDSKQPAYGVIAQDVEKAMPEAVQTTNSGTKTVEYSQLIAPMLEAIKQLENRVRTLEGRNNKLKGVNDNIHEKHGVMWTSGAR